MASVLRCRYLGNATPRAAKRRMFPLLSSRIPRGGTPSPRKRRQIEKAPDPVVSAQPIDPKAHALFAAELKAIPPQRNGSSPRLLKDSRPPLFRPWFTAWVPPGSLGRKRFLFIRVRENNPSYSQAGLITLDSLCLPSDIDLQRVLFLCVVAQCNEPPLYQPVLRLVCRFQDLSPLLGEDTFCKKPNERGGFASELAC